MSQPRISIFARYPEPGMAKTRLIPALGAEGAARVYARLLEGTVAQARTAGIPFELRVTGGREQAFHEWLGEDVAVVDQGDGDLGARMARGPAPALLIGSDCPGLTAPLLRAAADVLAESPVVIGPATDGGYYLIGFSQPMPFLFEDMEWSTPQVLTETLIRLTARGIGPAILPELSDIDLPEDLMAWPELQ
jgi:rSAM/selenodomain-associated transferase 1